MNLDYCQFFKTLENFIEHLKKKPFVSGIVEYGNRRYTDMSAGGDYDLFVILDENVALKAGGMSFYIADIPVDCGITYISDLKLPKPLNQFFIVFAKARIVYDRDGILPPLIDELSVRWNDFISPQFKESRKEFARFAQRHVIDKVKYRLTTEPNYVHFLLNANILWLFEDYMRIHNLAPGDFRAALNYCEKENPEAAKNIKRYQEATDINDKLKVTQHLAEQLLEKIGGPWDGKTISFHFRDSNDVLPKEERQHAIDCLLK